MDKKIVRQTGLSEAGLRRYLRKLAIFYGGLTKAEKRVYRASMGSKAGAMRSFSPRLTAAQLEVFLSSAKPRTECVCMVYGARADGDGNGDGDPDNNE